MPHQHTVPSCPSLPDKSLPAPGALAAYIPLLRRTRCEKVVGLTGTLHRISPLLGSMAERGTGTGGSQDYSNSQAGTQNPGITGTVANTAASVLNTVGLGRIVPGQVHPQQQGFANEGGAATAGQSQHGGFDGQQQGGQQFQEQQEQPYVHEEHATSPQGGHTFDSRATAGQGQGQSADGRSNAQASNFTQEAHETHGGGPTDGYTSQRTSSVSSETFESHESSGTQNNNTQSNNQTGTNEASAGQRQQNSSGFGGFGGYGAEKGQQQQQQGFQQSEDAQGNAEGAAGSAFNRVSRAIGKNPGNTAYAEGVSGTQGQDSSEPHGQMGSADVSKPSGQRPQAHSSATDEHAGQGITDAVRENM